MTTATITNTLLDGSGTALSGVVVRARLRPGPGFRVATSTEIGDVSTTTNGSGVWSLALEKTANISPANSWWEVEERLPEVNGGPRAWVISVTNDSALYANLLAALLPTPTAPTALTVTAGDARYAQLGANVWTANQTLSDGVNVVLGTVTGSKFGTSTAQKVGFLGATPVAQQANTVDICTVLSNFGLRASGGTPPATLGATTVTTLSSTGAVSMANGTGASTTLALDNTGGGAGRALDVKWNTVRAFDVGTTGVPKAYTGFDLAGSPSGYSGGELRFVETGSASAAISTSQTGAGIMAFDHRGASNTGSWRWNNGTNAGTNEMILSAVGLLTPQSLALAAATTSGTVGASGGVAALPANPAGYWVLGINGTNYKVPFYNA